MISSDAVLASEHGAADPRIPFKSNILPPPKEGVRNFQCSQVGIIECPMTEQAGKVTRDDVRLAGHVWGAFEPQGDRDFTRWTVKGLPLEREAAKDLRGLEGAERVALRDQLREAADAKLMERYGEFYAGSE